MALSQTLVELQSKVGTEIHTSNWEVITQEMINEFGAEPLLLAMAKREIHCLFDKLSFFHNSARKQRF